MSALGRVSYPVMLAALALGTFGGVFVLYRLGAGVYSLAVLAVTGGVGVLYLREYARRPLARAPKVDASAAPTDDEPFEDPVEEADRLARSPPKEGEVAVAPPAAAGPDAETDDGTETD